MRVFPGKPSRRIPLARYLFFVAGALAGPLLSPAAAGRAGSGPLNLALQALGGRARSWEPNVPVVPEHEAARANDGSLHSYWSVGAESLPADLGIEWAEAQTIASIIVRYFDGKMVRGPSVARTQQWARPQFWTGTAWKDLDAQVLSQETSVVRYAFDPVTTTRIRLLFTEPPDPEFRRQPDRLGIYVCELEAYREVPFRWITSDRLTHSRPGGDEDRKLTRYYNEPPSGDSGYDVAGPLIVEPKQTRIFSDRLTPMLIVSETEWARRPPRVEATGQTVRIGNGFIELECTTVGGLKETRLTNQVTGESVPTPHSTAFALRTSRGDLGPGDFKVLKSDSSASDVDAARWRVDLERADLDVAVHYELRRQNHFLHKWLVLRNRANSDLQVRDVVLSWLGLPRPVDLMAGQELTYPIVRLDKGGFFLCLETIYWEHQGDALVYYPGVMLKPGESLETEKAVVGVYKKHGETWLGWDRGVREWVIEYHDRISTVRPEWPDAYCEGWSAKIGLTEMTERPEWTERFFATAEKLGIRYMDGYEPMHQAMSMPAELVKRWADLAARHHIATGFWIDFGSDIDWGTGIPLKPPACQVAPEADQYFERLVEFVRDYQFKAFHWADFFTVFPCQRPDHGHLPGKYSVYAQGQRMLRFGQQLRQASPGVMMGADGGLTNPQFVRYEDSRAHGTFYGGYLGDHYPATEPDIHLDRLYADMNRVYISGSHAQFLRPWFRMLNVVNHYGQVTHHHDRAGFRYSLLSALAMAGQVTFNDAPDDVPESELAFSQHWLDWSRKNRDYLQEGDKLFDRSIHFNDEWQGDAEALSGFAHMRKDRGYIFLLNPSPVEQIANLTLALDAPAGQRFLVKEIYPREGALLGSDQGGLYRQGSEVRAEVPGKEVRVLWIEPMPAGSEAPSRGVSGTILTTTRYLGEWEILKKTPESATLRAHFYFPGHSETLPAIDPRQYLSGTVPEEGWAKEPYAYNKAYLVLLLHDENEELNNNWVPDNLHQASSKGGYDASALAISINGVPKTLHPFKTTQNQPDKLTRCYFIDLEGETKAGRSNDIELRIPIRMGLVFSGAYLDLPDQMP